jgi:hypothetical protein
MCKLIAALVFGSLLTTAASAQTYGPQQDCKTGEHWDQATKTCRM